ncbi:MAG: hypothetical protein L0H36_01665 [bacterium]|nr:hypothetical protein [bacterium]MDN5835322.1 hypothetical protein [bacterium]
MADIEREPTGVEKPVITIAGERVEVTPENTRCVKHVIGKVAIGDIVRNSSDFDYIRINFNNEETETVQVSEYAHLFRGAVNDMLFDPDNFEASISFLEQIGIPVQINTPSVSGAVIEKFYRRIEDYSNSLTNENLDDDLNDMIDSYRRDNEGNS